MSVHSKSITSWIGRIARQLSVTLTRGAVGGSVLGKLHLLSIVAVLIAAQPALAGTTGSWTTGAAPTATANGITITTTPSAAISPGAGTMNSTNYWNNPYTGTVAGAAALNYLVNPGSGTITVTFTFNKAVTNPVLHLQRMGGTSGNTNSSSWQLTGSNLGSAPTLSRLSGNFQFQVNTGTKTIFRTAGVASNNSGVCSATANLTSDDGGTGCGSVRINGTGITSLTFTVSMLGPPGVGDGMDLMWSIPNESIIIKKQSVGGTGTFGFSGTNGVPTTGLNTASSNPVSSAAASITNLTSPITITEAATLGFVLTGASCLDQTSAAIASSLAGQTLTIASSAYSDNGTITCTFVNQAVPVLAVAKSAPSPALVFGTNSTYTLTVTNSGAAPATTAQIKDQLPAGLSFVSATGPNWTCGNVSGLLTCNFAGGSIAPSGGTSVISVVATPVATAGNTTVTNYASVDPTGGAAAPTPGAACSPAGSCASNTAPIAAFINPASDTGSAVSGTPSTPIANVVANDAINGVAATLGASGNATVAQSGVWPTGITLNPTTGAITTTAGVQPGTYAVTYQLCDKSTPANCRTAVSTITVAANIVPVVETGTASSGTASTPIANVAANDSVNGAPATLGATGNATVAQSGVWPTGIALNPTTGAITTTTTVRPGTYPVTYQLCDKSTPVNCATMLDTITVAAAIVPVTENGTGVSGTASTVIANVAANDTVNGSAANVVGASSNATVAQTGIWATGISLNPTTGAVRITAAVLPGSYPITYQLCDKSTPINCAIMTDTVTVTASILPVVDSGSAVAGVASTPVANIASNDSVNGSPATISGGGSNATVAQSGVWPAGITLNPATGAVLASATAVPGTYPLQYQLCDRATPVNCALQTVTITVAAAISPVTESGSAVSGTPATAIANVRSNDVVNGVAATAANSTIAVSGVWPAGITLNPTTGAVTTAATVQPGTYSVAYQLCDRNTPVNCATVTDTVTVTANIAPIADSGFATSGVPTTPVVNVVANDAVNGLPATLGPSGNATVTTSGVWPTGVTLDPTTGAVSTSASVPPGTYTLQYQLCDKSTPANCQTQTVSITVTGNIAPLPESGTAVSGTAATPIANVAANDNVNGFAATLGTSGNATVAQSGVWPAGIALNPATGAVTTTSAVQPGTYLVAYQLCDKAAIPNCATVSDTITVSASIVPTADSGTASAGIPTTPIANIAANDVVNGVAAVLGASGNATVATSGTWPVGMTLDPLTGAVATSAGLAPGTYSLQYQLCDKNTPANCQTVGITVTVGASIVPVLENGAAVAGSPSTPIGNVAANDTVNNAPATLGASGNATVAQSGVWPNGITLNPTTGAISTTAGVVPGTYPVSYQLCDKNSPANCQTVIDTITVSANIAPVVDSGTATAGTSSTPVANVAANDTVNGVAATLGTSGNATVAQSGVWPAGIVLDPATGGVITTAAVPPGTYVVTYQLCDKNTPANCQTQTVTVIVNGAIAPNPDSGTAIAGTPTTPISNIAANDSVNGFGATLGASGNATIAVSGSWPVGISLNPATGAISTSAAVPPGSYILPYSLCDKVAIPNCANGSATITVSANIVPVLETGNAVSGSATTPIANVRANDNVNGAVATAVNSTIAQSGVWPAGIALNTTTGAITTSAAVQPGTYPVAYQLCDLNTPVNCQTVTDTITVAASILPVTENGSATSGTASTPIANVAANDNVNGFAATLGAGGNATVSQSGIWPAGIALDTATGAVSVASTVRPGTYPVSYQLCDKNTPANCQTISDTITVAAEVLPTPDTGAAAAGSLQTPIANVSANDNVNGSPVLLGGASPNATVATVGSWPAGVTLNPTSGAITTSATVPPGNYVLTYRLCDTNSPVNCADTTASFTLSASMLPLPDVGSGVSGTASTVIINVVTNDRVNGSTPTLLGASNNATVAQSGVWPAGITLNPLNGSVAITASVQPGVYVLDYELCDRNTPVNCAISTNTITVIASIVPIADAGSAVSGTATTPIANLAANDDVNGVAATLGASGNATVSTVGVWPAGITLDPVTGAVSTSELVQPGTYTVQYQLCDKSTPANCQVQTATITVSASILPTPDAGSSASGTPATPIANVTANDTVNGFAATLGLSGNATIAQSGTWPTGIVLDPATGAITTTADVQPGTYPVQYQLCDKNTPANCVLTTATVTVVGSINPSNDSGTAVSGTASTPIANLANNDIVNGVPATLGAGGNATVSQSGVWPVGITLDPVTGAISTSASVQPRTYVVQYQLCDKSAVPFCALANATIIVAANIAPTSDLGTATSGAPSTPIANVATNDTVNGAPATLGVSGNATITQVSTTNPGVTLNPATGAVSVTAAVQPGSYVVTYRLCDKNTPANCVNTTATVTVGANILPSTESGSAISGTPATPISNVAANDTVNGVNATLGASGNATVAISGVWPAGITLNPTTGAITTAATVQPGTYTIDYQLCDKNSPVNCATVTDTVTVTSDIKPRLDTGSAVAGTPSTAIANIAANDAVNGTPATLGGAGNATVAINGSWPAGITLDPVTGSVNIDASVVPGSYTLPYTLCDASTPANCANQDALITVFAAIRPSPDIVTVPASGGTAVPNVTANDVVNGMPAILGVGGNATVGESGTWPTGIALDPVTGGVTVVPGTPPGTYRLVYELCDTNLPVNCATSIVTINVTPVIVPVTEAGTAVSGTPTPAIANVAAGDMVNGIVATLGASGNATVAQSGTWPVGITLDPATGTVSTSASVQPGTYNFTYQLCDKNTPVNCAVIADQITVTPNIAPTNDAGSMVAGTASTPIANIAALDNVNGAPATLGASGNATIATSGTWPIGITLNPLSGAISVGARVLPGVYNVTYQLCDKNTPVNCQTAIATITVTASILPIVDNGTAVSGTPSTPIANIAANDTVNGTPALVVGSSPTASVAVVGTWPAGFGLTRSTGAVSISNIVAPGTYVLPYRLCDLLTNPGPANCNDSTATVVVAPAILPTPSTGTAVSGTASTPIANVAAGNMVNGSPAQTNGASPNATIAQSGVWPVGITLDPVTGAVALTPNVQPGVYALAYELCDTNTPANCQTDTVTITVAADIAPVADTGTATSGTASTPVANIAANDIVNGAPATLGPSGNATVATSGTWPVGITLDPATGAVSTSAAVQPGTYTVTYNLCDKSTPANCATQTVTIMVAGNIAPVADTGTATSGTASTPVANIAANDTVNGAPATLGPSGNATVATSGTWPVGITLDPTTGAVATSAAVQPGTYTVIYNLCDKSTPANCATQTVTITVAGNISPMADTGTATSGTPSTPVANIAANDSVNGSPATLGPSGNATVATSGTWPVGITLDPTTGAVATSPAVQPGTYTVTYNLCDQSTPANCQTQTVTITVAGNISPVADTGTATSGTASTPVANIAANDTVNGAPATLGPSGNATVATSGTWPVGITLDPTTGAVSTSAAVQPGAYTVTYNLCDKSTPANCQTQTVTITVAGNIAPVADTGTATSGTASTPVANIAANDTVNGAPATLGPAGNATVATSGTWPVGITLDPTTGAVSTSAAVQPGTYTVTYNLCDKNTPANCATQTVTITVAGNISPMADTGTATSGTTSTPVANIAANDTVNGSPATLGPAGNATVAPSGTWPAGITLDPTTGAVSTSAAVQPGNYTVTYNLCDKSTSANCQTQTVTITVAGNISPVADTGTATSGTPSTPVANIAANDTVNGSPATLGPSGNATVATSGTWPVGITLDPTTGAVSTSAAVQPGVYTVTYNLCDKSTPANCATQTVTITVAGNIAPVADTGTATSGSPSTPVANIAANDTVNGSPATLGPAGNATVAPSGTWPVGITLDPTTGAVSTSAAVQPGNYTVTYNLCDQSTPANCQTQTVTITVAGNISPVADTGTATSGTPSTPIANVAANDSVNGSPATLGPSGNATVATSGTWPVGITLDPTTGAVATSAAVQPGNYTVTYNLCDKSTPANCQTQTVTITVAGNISPMADTGTATSGTPSTPIANVAANDSVNGSPATLGPSGNATVATSGTWPVGITLDPTTGAVATSSAVQPGTYTVTYNLCDKSTPANCAVQTVTITVAGNILPQADAGNAMSGTASTPVANIAANDMVNGSPATLGPAGNATVATSGTWPTGVTLDPVTGAVLTSANVPADTYALTYQLCDKSTPVNCQTQTVTLTIAESKGSITGTVYLDVNADGQQQGNEPPRANWIVELVSNGVVVSKTTTDSAGNYRIDNVSQGGGYEIRFVNPENNVVYGKIANVSVTASTVVVDQDQPIDPAGVIFNSVTRAPVAGAVVTLVDTSGTPLPASCFIDASQRIQRTGASGEYRFDIVPGAAPQCPRSETVYRILVTPPAGYSADSTVLLPLVGPFDPTGLAAPVRISPMPVPAASGEVPYYMTFRLASGDPDVVFNHIPLDPFLTRTPLVVTKTTPLRSASTGDLVPYEITVRNTENVRRAGLTIVDILPAGMKFVEGSATIDGTASTPTVGDRELTWANQTIPANTSIRYRLVLVVGAGVTGGEKVNTGLARNPIDASVVSNRGTATITIAPSAVFDCSDVIGKVFEDTNRNGYQDEGEPGVPGVRVVTVNGQLITTDSEGRYHVTCAAVPDARIGSNFVLKVDTRSLPLDWQVTTDNPRSIRLTRGKMGELNFGVAPPEEAPRPETQSRATPAPTKAGEE
jgi:hypothetical protein